MANPITWQNVNGPSLADAAAPMKYAQQMFGGAFDGLQKELDKRQLTQTQNWDQGKVNNTADFMTALRTPQTAAEYNAAVAAGTFDKLRASAGAQVDQAAIGAAQDARLPTLQQRDVAANAFKDSMATAKAAPIIEQYKLLKLQGKGAEADALMASNPGLIGGADALDKGHLIDQRTVTEGRSAAEEAQKVLLRPLDIAKINSGLETDKSQRASAAQSILASQASIRNTDSMIEERATKHGAESAAADLEKAKNRLSSSLAGNRYKDGVYDGNSTEEIAKLIKEVRPDIYGKDQGSYLMDRIGKLAISGVDVGDGNKIPLSKADVKAVLAGTTNTLFSWNKGYADDFESRLKESLKTTVSGVDAAGKPVMRNPAADDYAMYQHQTRKSIEDGSALDAAITARKKKVK